MRFSWVAAAAMLCVATPALADAWDFILTNSTGKDIKLVELSPAGAGTWQPNKIDPEDKAKEIQVGKRTTIHFDKAASQCKWDVKATFSDGASAVWSSINLCDASFVTLRYANNTPTATAN